MRVLPDRHEVQVRGNAEPDRDSITLGDPETGEVSQVREKVRVAVSSERLETDRQKGLLSE